MKRKAFIGVFIGVVMAVVLTFQIASGEDWPMFHHDVALSGYTPDPAPNSADVLWVYQTSANIESSPVVVGDFVYIGSQDKQLYCLNKYTGAPVWSFIITATIQSSPAVKDGIVYFLSTAGRLYALEANTGSLIWYKDLAQGPWDWSSPAVHNGNVFVATSSGNLYSIAVTDGTINWQTNIGGTPDSPISVVNGVVYSGTHNFNNFSPTLVALDETTGAIRWTYDYFSDHSGEIGMVNSNGAAVVDGDGDGFLEIYFGVFNWSAAHNQAVCLNESTGTELWTQTINANTTSTPAVHNGKVFIGSNDGKLYALNADDGTEICSFQTGGEVWTAPAVSGDGKVCFGSLDHTVYCIDEDTCELIWSYYTNTSRLKSSPAISEGILYIGNENGKVYAFGFTAEIDIKPGSDPNCFNSDSHGVIPVAILSSAEFDATTVDPFTVSLDGANVRVKGKSGNAGSLEDVNSDGLLDLVVQIIDDGAYEAGNTIGTLTAKTLDGMSIVGTDTLCIVP